MTEPAAPPTDQPNPVRSAEAASRVLLRGAAIGLGIALCQLSNFLASKSSPTAWEFVGQIALLAIVVPTFLYIMLRHGIVSILSLVCVLLYLAAIIEDFAVCYKYAGLVGPAGAQIHNGFISVYFSAITFTTVGYGDFVPANDTGRALAACEALLGYLLLAVFVAKVINLSATPAER